MHSGSKYILFIALSLVLASVLYFLSLVCHAPVIVPVLLTPVLAFLLFRWLNTFDRAVPTDNQAPLVLAFIAGLFLITVNTAAIAPKHGGWDAWAMWNFHAHYLSHPDSWKNLFLNIENDHPDYPLFLSGLIGFAERLAHSRTLLMPPFAIAFFFTIAIPALIFLELQLKNGYFAMISIFLFALDSFYLKSGVSQYADTPLAFYFLCAVVVKGHIAADRRYATLLGFMLGCAIWVKNEGIILAAVFLVFNLRTLLTDKRYIDFFKGIVVPLAVLALLKLRYAPPNDMVGGQNASTLRLIFESSRYNTIGRYLLENLVTNFQPMFYGIIAYIVMCLLKKRVPANDFLMLMGCLIVYNLMYVISVNPLVEHLETSQDRLLHQLMPAFIFVILSEFTKFDFAVNSPTSLAFHQNASRK